MAQKFKAKHIIALLLSSLIVFFVLLLIFSFRWFIPKFNFLIIAFVISVFGALCVYYIFGKSKRSIVMDIGMLATLGIFIFLGMLGLAGFVTDVFGKTDQAEGKIISYYYWSRTCGYRLQITGFNPIGGGFCNVGKGENSIKDMEFVRLRLKVTGLGTLVSSIELIQNLNNQQPQTLPIAARLEP